MHFILDEAASLGHLECLDDAVDKYRGYGVRLQFYYQSVGQLAKCFPDGQDRTLLSNTCQVFFGVNDNDTAKHVSERLGDATIIVQDGGRNGGGSTQVNSDGHHSNSSSWGWSENWKQQGRKLLQASEVMALSARTAITFAPGVPPLATTLVRYYEEQNLGMGPSWMKRAWTMVTTWAAAVFLVVLAGSVAVMLTNAVNRDRVISYSTK